MNVHTQIKLAFSFALTIALTIPDLFAATPPTTIHVTLPVPVLSTSVSASYANAGGNGTIHLSTSKNCFIINPQMNSGGIYTEPLANNGSFVSWMFIMPSDISNGSTRLAIGGGNASGTTTSQSWATLSHSSEDLLTQYYITVNPGSKTFTAALPDGTTSTNIANLKTAFLAAAPAMETATITYPATPGSSIITYAATAPHFHQLAVYRPAASASASSTIDKWGPKPSGNPLGTIGSDWHTYNRSSYTEVSTLGTQLVQFTGPYCLVWDNAAHTLTVFAVKDQTISLPATMTGEILGSYTTPTGWNGDLAWIDNTPQAMSAGTLYQAYTSTGQIGTPTPPSGTITPTKARLLPSQATQLNWNVINGG